MLSLAFRRKIIRLTSQSLAENTAFRVAVRIIRSEMKDSHPPISARGGAGILPRGSRLIKTVNRAKNLIKKNGLDLSVQRAGLRLLKFHLEIRMNPNPAGGENTITQIQNYTNLFQEELLEMWTKINEASLTDAEAKSIREEINRRLNATGGLGGSTDEMQESMLAPHKDVNKKAVADHDPNKEAFKYAYEMMKASPSLGWRTVARKAVDTFFPELVGNARAKRIDTIRNNLKLKIKKHPVKQK
jgi:hypothetical protein